jgi:hypothetical protein
MVGEMQKVYNGSVGVATGRSGKMLLVPRFGWKPKTMKIALNWFEVTLPANEITVPVQTLPLPSPGESKPGRPWYQHRVVQRRGPANIRLLHLTDNPPGDTQEETLKAADDPTFVKIAVEEGFSQLLTEKGFAVHRRHVGGTAYRQTNESLWPSIYTFLRGISFRAFFFISGPVGRWGIVLNYATSQQFRLTLEDDTLRAMAHGKRVVRVREAHESEDDEHRHSGILLTADGSGATVDVGADTPLKSGLGDWTLPCRRELLHDYVSRTQGSKAGADLTRKLLQASFCLTESGRMNTALAKQQIEAVQRLLHQHKLGQILLPLPARPPAAVSFRPLTVVE